MEARPCPIIEFFNGTKQMLVPLFQRPYEWGETHWETLWQDLLERYELRDVTPASTHFTGAIVTAPAKSVPVGVSKHLVIDGQQRLTTVAIVLCAIRSFLDPETKAYRKLSRLLVNEDDEGLDRFKLLPTQPDRAAFGSLIDAGALPKNRFTDAFEYFRRRIKGKDSEGVDIDIEKLAEVLQSRMTVVSIHLGEADDPYLIFESLNAKGAPLTQADLIRNYLLLRIHTGEQARIYQDKWLPMQEMLPGEHLSEYMRQYLMLSGDEVVKSAIYSVLKRRISEFPDEAVPLEIQRMHECSKLYSRIVGLAKDPDPSLESALSRIRRWEVSVASPLLLRMLEAREKGNLSAAEICEAIAAIESFVIRRYICRVPTNQLKRIFLALTKDLPLDGLAKSMRLTMAGWTAGRRWPRDAEFADSWTTYKAYLPPIDRCKLVLETLESSFEHKERPSFDMATIEHIMPQTLTQDWRSHLGKDVNRVHEVLLDTIGNLTLTAYNSELSNAPFEEKRKLLADSNFQLNRAVSTAPNWTETEIRSRAQDLLERAKKLWPGP